MTEDALQRTRVLAQQRADLAVHTNSIEADKPNTGKFLREFEQRLAPTGKHVEHFGQRNLHARQPNNGAAKDEYGCETRKRIGVRWHLKVNGSGGATVGGVLQQTLRLACSSARIVFIFRMPKDALELLTSHAALLQVPQHVLDFAARATSGERQSNNQKQSIVPAKLEIVLFPSPQPETQTSVKCTATKGTLLPLGHEVNLHANVPNPERKHAAA